MTTMHHSTELESLCRARTCSVCEQPMTYGGSIQAVEYTNVVALCQACFWRDEFFLHAGVALSVH